MAVEKMMPCDAHVHIGPSFPEIKTSFNIRDFLKYQNKYDVQYSLISSCFRSARSTTKKLEKRKLPGCFLLVQGYGAGELERALRKGTAVGMKINPSQLRKRVTNGCFREHYEILEDYSGVLQVHCGRWREMSGWEYPVKIAKKYKNITVILAHMGGTHVNLTLPCLEEVRNMKNVYFDTSQARQPIVMTEATRIIGPRRILFGTDVPWGSFYANMGFLIDTLDGDDFDDVIRNNFIDMFVG